MWSPAGALAHWQVLEELEADPGEPPPLRVDPYIAHYLQESSAIDAELLECASYVAAETPLPGWPVAEVSARIAGSLGQGCPNRIWVVGQRLSGRQMFAACVARYLGSPLISVDTSRISERDWARIHVRIRRHALLNGCAVAWCGGQVQRACMSAGAKIPLEFAILEPHPRWDGGKNGLKCRGCVPRNGTNCGRSFFL
jgi:hypothetical protein